MPYLPSPISASPDSLSRIRRKLGLELAGFGMDARSTAPCREGSSQQTRGQCPGTGALLGVLDWVGSRAANATPRQTALLAPRPRSAGVLSQRRAGEDTGCGRGSGEARCRQQRTVGRLQRGLPGAAAVRVAASRAARVLQVRAGHVLLLPLSAPARGLPARSPELSPRLADGGAGAERDRDRPGGREGRRVRDRLLRFVQEGGAGPV